MLIINALLLASLIGRYVKDNAAIAQAQPATPAAPASFRSLVIIC